VICENVGFDENRMFLHVHMKAYDAILRLLKEFRLKKQNIGMQAAALYMNNVKFLLLDKMMPTIWKKKFRPVLSPYLIQKLKQVKRVRNKYAIQTKRRDSCYM
jgi:hypothetical protein